MRIAVPQPARVGAPAPTAGTRSPLRPAEPRLLELQRRLGNRQVQRDLAAAGLGSGRGLGTGVRRELEAAFGWDFGSVRLHAGAEAAEATRRLGAKAFTSGRNVVFGSRVGDPESTANRSLLVHELAHVVQQARGAEPGRSLRGGLSAALSAAPVGRAQAVPTVTGVAGPAEVGVGRSISTNAVVAPGTPAGTAVTWTLVGAPAGVTLTPAGRRATIRVAAGAFASAGALVGVRAALAANPADNFTLNVRVVGITAITFAPNPAFAPIAALIPAAGLPNTAEPNRDGLAGNTGTVNAVTAPAGRPTRVTLRTALGATVAGNVITPGTTTGTIGVRVTDNATGSIRDAPLPVNPVPLRLSAFAGQVAAGPYGARNALRFQPSHATAFAAFNRIVGETITAGGQDDLNITPTVNAGAGGPNPAPLLALAVPANTWNDNLVTGVGAVAGAAGDANLINVNRYVGPGVAAKLPRLTIFRQGFHYSSWTGAWSTEFDHGEHRRSLRGVPGAFIFRTEHVFPAASSPVRNEPYAGPPLIVLTALTAVPLLPLAAGGIAADGVATGQLTIATTVAGRNVNWSVLTGPAAFTVPALGAAAAVAAPATLRAGTVPRNIGVRVFDSVFANRRLDGVVRLVPVVVGGIAAPVASVPPATLVAAVNVNAAPGGRTINWTVDPAAAGAGVTVAPVAPVNAALPARSANVTRPAAFTGRVTVTAADSVLAGKRASTTIRFR